MATIEQYGMNADGSVSICRAKPGNEGRYGCHHTKHVQISAQEASAINEAVNQVELATSAAGLSKKNSFVSKIDDLLDSDTIYEDSVKLMQEASLSHRSPIEEQDLPNNPSFSDEEELSNGDYKADWVGAPLTSDEEHMVLDRLTAYSHDRASGSRPVSPSEEMMIRTLLMNPAASKKTLDTLSTNPDFVHRSGDWLVNSPNVSSDEVDNMWSIDRKQCLEAQKLDAKHVDEALQSKDLNVDDLYDRDLVKNALRHPNANPKLAYETMERIHAQSGPTFNDSDIQWSLSLNPNKQFQEEFAALDKDAKYLLTKDLIQHKD